MERARFAAAVFWAASVFSARGEGVALDDPGGVLQGWSNGGKAVLAAPLLMLMPCGLECLHDTADCLDYEPMFLPALASLDAAGIHCSGFALQTNGLLRLGLDGQDWAWGDVWVGSPPLRWGELCESASIHRCAGGVQTFCFACGRRHAEDEGHACSHTPGCAARASYANACTCPPLLVRVNWNGDEVLPYRAAGLTQDCCCGYGMSEGSIAQPSATSALCLHIGADGAASFGIEALTASAGIGTETVSYEVHDATNGVLRTIARAVTAANLEIRPDFNDDGTVDSEDRSAWWHEGAWQVRVREEPYRVSLVNECPVPADLSLTGTGVAGTWPCVRSPGAGGAALPIGETVRTPAFVVKNATCILEVDTSGGPGTLDLAYALEAGGAEMASCRRIHAVDTSVPERWATSRSVADLVYDYTDVAGDVWWSVWGASDDACLACGTDKLFTPGSLPPGDYVLEVYFADVVEDGWLGYLSSGGLHVVDVRLDRLYETANPANRIFNPTRKDDTSGNFAGETEKTGTPDEERYATPRNYLYLVGDPETGNFDVSARFDAVGAAGCTNYYCAFYNGETKVPGSETNVDLSAASVRFSIPAATTNAVDVLYQLRGGLDLNGNGTLDNGEADAFTVYTNSENRRKKAYVKGITRGGFATHIQDLQDKVYCYSETFSDNPPSLVAAAARSLLALFYGNGNMDMLGSDWMPTTVANRPLDAFSTNCSCFAEWLTHNGGAAFNTSGVASVAHYTWGHESGLSKFLEQRKPFALKTSQVVSYPGVQPGAGGIQSGPLKIRVESATPTGLWLKEFYENNVRQQAEQFLQNMPTGSETNMPTRTEWYRPDNIGTNAPFVSLSPGWVPGSTIVVGQDDGYSGWGALFSQFATENGAFNDFVAFGAIGRGRLVDPRYQFTVRRNGHIMSSDTFDVTEIRFACTITDLYDFNYEDGNLPACAAAAQIGYGAGTVSERAAHGKIFSHEIEIEASFSDPFEFYTTIEGN